MPPSKEISATHCAKFNMLVNILLLLLFVLCYCFFYYYMFMFLRRLFNVWTLVRAALFYYSLSKFIVARKRCFCWFFLFVLCTSVLWPQSLRKNTKRLLLSLSLCRTLFLCLASCACVCLRLIVCRAVDAAVDVDVAVFSSRACICIAFYSTHNQTSSVSRPVIREATTYKVSYDFDGFCAFSFNLISLLFIKFAFDYRHW